MSTKTKTTRLQATAAAETDAKMKTGIFSAVLGLLGIKGKAADEAAAKMTKVTEKYSEKREKTSEESTDAGDEEEEEEEESAGGTGSTDGGSSTGTGSTGTSEEEEEEGAKKGEHAKAKAKKPAEEEEEEAAKAVSRASRACRAAADAAYAATAATFPPALAQQLALRSPARVLRVARHATGARGIDDVMTALDRMSGASASAERIKTDAKLEARVVQIETDGRKARIDGIVAKAKAEGRAGALTKDGRASLRAHGMANGSKALTALVVALPVVARTTGAGARVARGDGGEGIDRSGDSEERGDGRKLSLVESMTANLSPEAAKAWEAEYQKRLSASNGAARTPRGG